MAHSAARRLFPRYDPMPKSLMRTVEAQGEGVKCTFVGVAANGKPIAYGFPVQFDGKDNPISGSMPQGADAISAKHTDSITMSRP